ncbi:MAG: hypothetical protein EA407_10605 [Rhodobacteraceae bacterium]|nr:MAG: hypothetical protein EA407_10605 [Paracoccaceae bacterium]
MGIGSSGRKGKTMTEAMSRREIEDVLTSIRRLVSHDSKQSTATPQTEPASTPANSEKLVLTSALRVDQPALPTTTETETSDTSAQPAPEAEFAPDPTDVPPAEPGLAQLGADEVSEPQTTDTDTPDPAPVTRATVAVPTFDFRPPAQPSRKNRSKLRPAPSDNWSGLFMDAPHQAEPSFFADKDDTTPVATDTPSQASQPQAAAPDGLLARIQKSGAKTLGDLVAPRIEQTERPEGDAPSVVDTAPGNGDSLVTKGDAPAQSETGAISFVPPPHAELKPDAEVDDLQQSIEDASLEATLSRLETLLGDSATPMHEPAPETPPEMPLSEPAAEKTAERETVIDEGMLYQLVANIVRQELQGELGEKITRNIRKLVRAEVARELALRKL